MASPLSAGPIWRPFTQHLTEPDPIKIIRAEKEFLYTEAGETIIDCISSWWTIAHGHNHPVLNQALREQLDKFAHVMFAGFDHEAATGLATDLIAATNGAFDKVFFSDNGSTAVEVALKTAYQYHYNIGAGDRRVFLCFGGGYHGDTFGAMAVGRGTGFYDPFAPLLTEVIALPYPDTAQDTPEEVIARRESEALKQLETVLEKNGHNIAAFILEPLLLGAGGMRMCRPGFIRAACEKVRAAGILVIFDEVAVGFGRTGSLFAYEQIGFIPDFICLSKALTGGYAPLSVTMTQNKIFDAFLAKDFKKAFTHGHSFTAHALACAVARASLRLFETEKTLTKVAEINAAYQRLYARLKDRADLENFRTLGNICAFNLKANTGYKSARSETLRAALIAEGFNIRPLGDVVYLLPPYCISEESLEKTFTALERLTTPRRASVFLPD